MKAVVIHKKNSILRFDYYLLYLVVIVPFLWPYYFTQLDSLYIFKQVVSYTSVIIMTIFFLLHSKTIKIPIFFFCFWYLILFCSTWLCSGQVVNVCKHIIRVILLCLNVGVIIREKDKQYSFLCAVRDWSVFLFLINLVIVYKYPMGMPGLVINPSASVGPYFLYGNVNATIKYVFPAMCCTTLLDIKKEKVSFFMVFFMSGLVYIFITVYHMATALMGLIVITIWFVFRKRFQSNLKTVYLAGVLSVVVVEILLVVISNASFMTFIARLFGKSASFSGRLFLWQKIINQIIQKPWVGYGLQPETVLLSKIGNLNGSHNYYLDLIYQMGIIGILIFVFLVLLPALKLKRHSCISGSLYVLIGYWLAFMVMFLTEPFFGWEYIFIPILYAIILLAGKRTDIPKTGCG